MKNSTLLISALVTFLLFTNKKAVGIGAITKTKFLPPYSPDGKTTFKNMRGKPGTPF